MNLSVNEVGIMQCLQEMNGCLGSGIPEYCYLLETLIDENVTLV